MDEKIRSKLRLLFAEYQKNLPQKIIHLEQQWQDLSIHFDSLKFHEFHRHIHTLHGSLATYGYPKLAVYAKDIEIFVKSLLPRTTLSSEDKNTINQLLKKFKTAFLSAKQIPADDSFL